MTTDYPIQWVLDQVNERRIEAAKVGQKMDVHQKFTCGKCGSRQTIGDINVFYAKGECEECGHVTDLRIAGCNYLAILTRV